MRTDSPAGRSAATPGTFVTVEEWRDQAALDGRMTSDHIATALRVTADALAVPPAIHPPTEV